MRVIDAYGLEMQADDPDALARHERLADGYLMFEPDMVERMSDAVAPGLGHTPPLTSILHAQLMAMSHTAEGVAHAGRVAEGLADRELLPREALHCSALTHVAAGEVDRATAAWGRLLDDYPTDLVALRLQHFALFNRGDLTQMLRRVEAAKDHWAALAEGAVPHGSLLDGMACFALEENGRYDDAEPLGRAAVDADPDDLWAVHAVAHVLEMQGRADEGAAWIRASEPALHRHGSFAGHVWWHLALYLLEVGDHDGALRLFDDEVYRDGAVEGLTLTNAVALLARIEWAGGDVGERWSALVEGASLRIGHHSHPFNDCHYAYSLARAGRRDLAHRLVGSMRDWADGHHDTAAGVILSAASSTAEGMLALGSGEPAAALRLLAQDSAARWRIGGSHAQRDLFAQAQLQAAIEAGDSECALDLVGRRIAAKPNSPRNQRWVAAATTGTAHERALARAEELGWSS